MQISTESVELEELREMKADVERREKAQAAVLERQAKRLEELETLYKVSPVFNPSHIEALGLLLLVDLRGSLTKYDVLLCGAWSCLVLQQSHGCSLQSTHPCSALCMLRFTDLMAERCRAFELLLVMPCKT